VSTRQLDSGIRTSMNINYARVKQLLVNVLTASNMYVYKKYLHDRNVYKEVHLIPNNIAQHVPNTIINISSMISDQSDLIKFTNKRHSTPFIMIHILLFKHPLLFEKACRRQTNSAIAYTIRAIRYS
jgi:hypothetical protein